jgi:hypothetical protein
MSWTESGEQHSNRAASSRTEFEEQHPYPACTRNNNRIIWWSLIENERFWLIFQLRLIKGFSTSKDLPYPKLYVQTTTRGRHVHNLSTRDFVFPKEACHVFPVRQSCFYWTTGIHAYSVSKPVQHNAHPDATIFV